LPLEPYSLAVGVGHMRIASVSDVPGWLLPALVVCRAELSASLRTQVGHNEEAVPLVRRSNVGGGDDAGLDAIAKPCEVADNSVQPARNERRNVFDDDEDGPHFADDARELAPEAGSLAVDPGPLAGGADVLAGESPADDVNASKVCFSDRADIVVSPGLGPMRREHAAAKGIALDLP
jgi:hypothetical protein